MTDPRFRDDMTVTLLRHMGDDEAVCQAARVSTLGAGSVGTEEAAGLIRYLVSHRHGSPFEHTAMTFYVEAPIFVFREFMRHRIGFSYNEESARYRDLEPVFYVPNPERRLLRSGTPARPTFEPGTGEQVLNTRQWTEEAACEAWTRYGMMREQGVASEVARGVLPVGIYSSAYVTCNLRSLMSFLSLRTHRETATFVSYPQAEIEMVAVEMERIASDLFPLSLEAFSNNGRVSP